MAGPSGKNPPADTTAHAAAPDRAARRAPDDLSEIDFSSADVPLALSECADLVEVQESVAGIGAVYEEAAVLYANGAGAEAEALLDAALANGTSAAGEGLWMMLLDLYRLTGQRERFESRVLDYATRFERSPPPWENLCARAQRPRIEVAPLINLAGNLGGHVAAQVRQLLVIGQKSGAVRIDLKRLRAADEQGCTLLLDAIRTLVRERVRVTLLNGEALAAVLAGRLQAGRAEDRNAWLLLLELLQYSGDAARFEQLALDYAITFEESPPSWEPRVEPPPVASVVAEAALDGAVASEDRGLQGELVGANNDMIRKLIAVAADQPQVVIDCSRLRRMDFVSAGTLFNVLSTLTTEGRQVRLQQVNAMVAALLRVMGVDQVAQITLRT